MLLMIEDMIGLLNKRQTHALYYRSIFFFFGINYIIGVPVSSNVEAAVFI